MTPNRMLASIVCALILSGCTTTKEAALQRNQELLDQQLGNTQPEAANKRIIDRYFDEWVNRGDAAVADALIAPNLVLRNPPSVLNGLEEYKARMAAFHAAFPDGRYSIEDQIAAGDKVVVRWILRGTHRGEFQGRPPTGKTMSVTGTSTFRIDSGKIQEIWVNMDRLGMMEQLGWLPAPGQAPK